jgi:RimJ/RimL family protein N-acetyltransferase
MTPGSDRARLDLLPFALSDADALFLIRGDAEAMRHWDWPGDTSPEETAAVVRGILRDVEAGTAGFWTVRRASDGAFVGVVDLSEIDGQEADLGFMIRRDFWGQGYALAAATLAVRNAWSMGLARLRARIHADNTRSQKLLERLGFAPQDERRVEVRPGVTKQCRFFLLQRV